MFRTSVRLHGRWCVAIGKSHTENHWQNQWSSSVQHFISSHHKSLSFLTIHSQSDSHNFLDWFPRFLYLTDSILQMIESSESEVIITSTTSCLERNNEKQSTSNFDLLSSRWMSKEWMELNISLRNWLRREKSFVEYANEISTNLLMSS